jgi:hypothetical protein
MYPCFAWNLGVHNDDLRHLGISLPLTAGFSLRAAVASIVSSLVTLVAFSLRHVDSALLTDSICGLPCDRRMAQRDQDGTAVGYEAARDASISPTARATLLLPTLLENNRPLYHPLYCS